MKRFAWSETKRLSNLRDHGLDFLDVPLIFDGPTFTYEDDRFDYPEQRYVTLGFLKGMPVSIVHTETDKLVRVLSLRKATRIEGIILYENVF